MLLNDEEVEDYEQFEGNLEHVCLLIFNLIYLIKNLI